MYTNFFRLSQKPFSIAPDPSFLYLSDRHREALAHLMYGLQTEGGFVLITGEVGTGKTTLIRSLIERVPDALNVAFVLNPRLTVKELLETLCDELGVAYRGENITSIKHYVDLLTKHLLTTHSQGRSTVVIIDEAQNLTPAVLEQIRLLTNLETNEHKLLRIILLGQPELAELLDKKELRQLAQRITARYHLAPLSRDDTRAYVIHRLTLASGDANLFTRGATGALYRLSSGIPRLVNVIADRALLGAYVEGKHRVSASIVRKAAAEVFGRKSQWQRWLAGAAGLLVAVGAAWAILDVGEKKVPVAAAPAPPIQKSLQRTTELPATGNVDGRVGAVSDREVAVPAPASSRSSRPVRTAPTEPTAHDSISRPVGIGTTSGQAKAYGAVFERWGVPYQSNNIPCDYAPSVGLQCLKQSGDWRTLGNFGRPVVLELWDDGTTPYYAALLSMDGEELTLSFGEQPLIVTREALEAQWYGTFIVLWLMPPDYRGNLKLGDVDPVVGWLRNHLAGVLNFDLASNAPNRFDSRLHDALIQFQRRESLTPDGIAGPETWIHLNTKVSSVVPRLAGDERGS
jgi:general secretion pathway protein A